MSRIRSPRPTCLARRFNPSTPVPLHSRIRTQHARLAGATSEAWSASNHHRCRETSIPEAGAKPSNAPASRTSAGTTCATPGRAGWYSAACRCSSCRNWADGSPQKWCGGMRTYRRRSMRAMRRRSIWSFRGIPSRAAAEYSRAGNWHQKHCSAAMRVAGVRATQCPVLLSHITTGKHFTCFKTMLTQAKVPVRFDCFAGQLPTYMTKLSSTSR